MKIIDLFEAKHTSHSSNFGKNTLGAFIRELQKYDPHLKVKFRAEVTGMKDPEHSSDDDTTLRTKNGWVGVYDHGNKIMIDITGEDKKSFKNYENY